MAYCWSIISGKTDRFGGCVATSTESNAVPDALIAAAKSKRGHGRLSPECPSPESLEVGQPGVADASPLWGFFGSRRFIFSFCSGIGCWNAMPLVNQSRQSLAALIRAGVVMSRNFSSTSVVLHVQPVPAEEPTQAAAPSTGKPRWVRELGAIRTDWT